VAADVGRPKLGEPSQVGTVALVDLGAWFARFAEGFRSDRLGKFSESCRETQTFMTGFNAEFVVPAAQVLNERVIANHVRRSPISS
jgi:hypothetical protein